MDYQIKVQGYVDASWSEWFSGMDIYVATESSGAVLTTLTGPVADQSALRGILNRIWDLNLSLVSVIGLEPQGADSDSCGKAIGGKND